MVVYIAAPYVHMKEAREARTQLQAAGIDVNSRWLDMDPDHDLESTPPSVLTDEATKDFDDVCSADGLVVLNLAKSEGKAVELGIGLSVQAEYEAVDWHYPIIVVGKPSNVFHYYPSVSVVDTLEQAIEVLNG